MKMDPNVYAMVLDTLNRATNQNADVLKPAEKKLQEWETEPGFYSLLLEVFSNHTINVNVRWLAVMCFKNGIDKYWRKNAPNSLSEEEKIKLRMGLLSQSILSEPVTQIATQLAVLISKIARFDCPTNWPNLVPDIMNAMKTPQHMIQHRALLMFHHIVKAMASKRLIGDRKTFSELTNSVYSYILSLWHENTETFLRNIQQSGTNESIIEPLEKALLCLRILRKLTVFGFKKAHECPEVIAFLNVIFDRAKTSLECRKLLKGRGIYPLELCEKFIIHLTKVALGVLETHPFSFIPLIVPALEFTIYYCFTEQGMMLIYERFTIQCLNIIKGILTCMEYKVTKSYDHTKEPLTMEAHQLKLRVLSDNTVCHMCRHLVTNYFLLKSDDLELWDTEPESFATDETGESWKYSLRPCTEAVFLELFQEFREILVPELVGILMSLQQEPIQTHNLQSILKRDAVYNAVGLTAFELYDDVDFDEWFTNVLSKELKIKDNNYRIIRRRVAFLIGHWVGVRASQQLRPAIYESLIELMSDPNEDMAVKLSAADALRSTVDDFKFDPEQFAPYIKVVFDAMYNLLVEAEECDTKMHILHILSLIIQCNNGAVAWGCAESLMQYLPQLWEHASSHDMLRTCILNALVTLVKALETEEQVVGSLGGLRSWIISVIGAIGNLGSPQLLYLLEDALELWLILLQTADVMQPDLMALSNILPAVLEFSTDHLRIVVHIMQAYILLCPDDFMMDPGAKCMHILDDMLADMRIEGVAIVLKMAESCLCVSYSDRNPLLGVQVLWPILKRVVKGVMEAQDLPMVFSVQLCLLSRVILKSTDLFFKLIEEVAAGLTELSCDPTKVLGALLDVWTDRMNVSTQVERWKIAGLGLAALLTTQNTVVLERFSPILLNITEVLNDVMKMEGSEYIDGLVCECPSRCASPLEGRGSWSRLGADRVQTDFLMAWGPHVVRHTTAHHAPAHSIDTRKAVLHQLETLKVQVGQENYDRLIQSVDAETLKQLREYIPI